MVLDEAPITFELPLKFIEVGMVLVTLLTGLIEFMEQFLKLPLVLFQGVNIILVGLTFSQGQNQQYCS